MFIAFFEAVLTKHIAREVNGQRIAFVIRNYYVRIALNNYINYPCEIISDISFIREEKNIVDG